MSRILCDVAGLGKVMKAKKGTWLDQRKIKHELSRKPLSAHQQRQLAHTAAGESTCSKDGCVKHVRLSTTLPRVIHIMLAHGTV